jgi:hypothetical protein
MGCFILGGILFPLNLSWNESFAHLPLFFRSYALLLELQFCILIAYGYTRIFPSKLLSDDGIDS